MKTNLSILLIVFSFVFSASFGLANSSAQPLHFDGISGSFLLPVRDVQPLLPADFELVPQIPEMLRVHPISFFIGPKMVVYMIEGVKKKGENKVMTYVPGVLVTEELKRAMGEKFGKAVHTAQIRIVANQIVAEKNGATLASVEWQDPGPADPAALKANFAFQMSQPKTFVFPGTEEGSFLCSDFEVSEKDAKIKAVSTSGSFSFEFPGILPKDFLNRHLGQTPLGSFQIQSLITLQDPIPCLKN